MSPPPSKQASDDVYRRRAAQTLRRAQTTASSCEAEKSSTRNRYDSQKFARKRTAISFSGRRRRLANPRQACRLQSGKPESWKPTGSRLEGCRNRLPLQGPVEVRAQGLRASATAATRKDKMIAIICPPVAGSLACLAANGCRRGGKKLTCCCWRRRRLQDAGFEFR